MLLVSELWQMGLPENRWGMCVPLFPSLGLSVCMAPELWQMGLPENRWGVCATHFLLGVFGKWLL